MAQTVTRRRVSVFDQPVPEGGTFTYYSTLRDEQNPPQPVPASDLATLVLSIRDTETGTIINGVDHVDILNADRGKVDGNGLLEISVETGDTALATGVTKATRSLIIEWTWGTGIGRKGRHQVDFPIIALSGDA